MSGDREERIRARAHQIWEREGRPGGREADHWHQASREVDAEGEDAAQQAVPGDAMISAGGVGSGLQPGGTALGSGPAAGQDALGAGGGSTAGRATGSVKRGRKDAAQPAGKAGSSAGAADTPEGGDAASGVAKRKTPTGGRQGKGKTSPQ